MAISFKEFRGISRLVYAPLLGEGDNERYGEVKPLSGVQSLASETEEVADIHYYDNGGEVAIDSEGADIYTITVSVTALETRAVIEGKYWDPVNHFLLKYKPKHLSRGYFALGYLADTTDGRQICNWVYRGKFTGGGQTHDTIDEGTGATNVEYTFTAIPSGKHYLVDGVEKPVKSLAISAEVVDPDTFFAEVMTPDSIPTDHRLPDYAGATTIRPTVDPQTLPTANTSLRQNIRVLPVTAGVDSNIRFGAVRQGVNILGLEGEALPRAAAYEGATEVAPTAEPQTLPTRGRYMASDITVEEVTAEVDPNITPSNIRQGVEILGVEGAAVIRHPEFYEGETDFAPTTAGIAIPARGKYFEGDLTVEAVPPSVDPDISEMNIKEGEAILGVTGVMIGRNAAYEGEVLINANRESDVVLPTAHRYLPDNIFIDPVPASIDGNITPENVKRGTSILGVDGTLIPPNPTFTQPTTIQPSGETQVVETAGTKTEGDVTVAAVTSAVLPYPEDEMKQKIAAGVDILGVEGRRNVFFPTWNNMPATGGTIPTPSIGFADCVGVRITQDNAADVDEIFRAIGHFRSFPSVRVAIGDIRTSDTIPAWDPNGRVDIRLPLHLLDRCYAVRLITNPMRTESAGSYAPNIRVTIPKFPRGGYWDGAVSGVQNLYWWSMLNPEKWGSRKFPRFFGGDDSALTMMGTGYTLYQGENRPAGEYATIEHITHEDQTVEYILPPFPEDLPNNVLDLTYSMLATDSTHNFEEGVLDTWPMALALLSLYPDETFEGRDITVKMVTSPHDADDKAYNLFNYPGLAESYWMSSPDGVVIRHYSWLKDHFTLDVKKASQLPNFSWFGEMRANALFEPSVDGYEPVPFTE